MLDKDELKIAIEDARARQPAVIQLQYFLDTQAMNFHSTASTAARPPEHLQTPIDHDGPATFAEGCRFLGASHLPQSEAVKSASAARASSRAAFLFRTRERSTVGHPSAPRPERRFPIRSTDGRCRPNPRKHSDVLVRLRLKEIGLEVPHPVVAVTSDGEAH